MSLFGKKDGLAKSATVRVSKGSLPRQLSAMREQWAYALVSSLGRFFQRPFASATTVGVMAVALALPLGLTLALINVERFSGNLQQSQAINVFLKIDVAATQVERIAVELRQRADVTSVTIKTPEQGLAEFRKTSELAGTLAALDGNPLPTVLVIEPRDDGVTLAAILKARPDVDLVQHDALWQKRLSAWLSFAMQALLVIAALLGLSVLLVVGNTIRLEIGLRREEIAVMQQLGATDGFIRRPFLFLGAWHGLAAGLLALALLVAAQMALQPSLSRLVLSYDSAFTWHGLGLFGTFGLVVGASALGWIGAWLATGHHLRQTRPTDL